LVGMAVGAEAGLAFAAVRVAIEVPIDIAGDEQIERAITVIVEEHGSSGPAGGGDTGFVRYVYKRAIAAIAVEDVATVVRDVEVRVAVVVEIACSDAHSV